jgi:hypothetical protein
VVWSLMLADVSRCKQQQHVQDARQQDTGQRSTGQVSHRRVVDVSHHHWSLLAPAVDDGPVDNEHNSVVGQRAASLRKEPDSTACTRLRR